MELVITFLIAVIIGLVVYLVCRVVPFLTKYADIAGLLTFLLVLLFRLT